MTISPACEDGQHEQCDGRVVVSNEVYPCECACHHDEEKAA